FFWADFLPRQQTDPVPDRPSTGPTQYRTDPVPDRPSTGPTQYRTDPVPDRPSTGPARCRSDRRPEAVRPAVVPPVRHRSACRRARLSATGPLGRLAGRHTSRPPAVRRLSVACPARFGTHLSSALVRRDHSPSTRVLAPGFCLSLLTQVS